MHDARDPRVPAARAAGARRRVTPTVHDEDGIYDGTPSATAAGSGAVPAAPAVPEETAVPEATPPGPVNGPPESKEPAESNLLKRV